MVNEEEFGTAADYVEAFKALEKEGLLPRRHKALMQAHFQAVDHTSSWEQLAEDVGYSGGRAVNLQYGTLAGRVARRLGITDRPRGFWLFVLADWAPERDSRGYTAFVLRRPVIDALKRLGIVRVELEHASLEAAERELSREVGKALALSQEERIRRLAEFPRRPERKLVTTTAFLRNPYVIAEVLTRARGTCERCDHPAPFLRVSDGTPYLEVHHIERLADGGEDTVENAIALCPNCHRKAHHG